MMLKENSSRVTVTLLHFRNHSFPLSNGQRGGGRVGQWMLGRYDINNTRPGETAQTHTVLKTPEQYLKALVTDQGRTYTGRKPGP